MTLIPTLTFLLNCLGWLFFFSSPSGIIVYPHLPALQATVRLSENLLESWVCQHINRNPAQPLLFVIPTSLEPSTITPNVTWITQWVTKETLHVAFKINKQAVPDPRTWERTFPSLSKPLATIQPGGEIFPLCFQTNGRQFVGVVPLSQCMHNIKFNLNDGHFWETTHTSCAILENKCKETDRGPHHPVLCSATNTGPWASYFLSQTQFRYLNYSDCSHYLVCNVSFAFSLLTGRWLNATSPNGSNWVNVAKQGQLECTKPDMKHIPLVEIWRSVLCRYLGHGLLTNSWIQINVLFDIRKEFSLLGHKEHSDLSHSHKIRHKGALMLVSYP